MSENNFMRNEIIKLKNSQADELQELNYLNKNL